MSDDVRARAQAAADAAAAAATPGGSAQDVSVLVSRPQAMQGPFAGEIQGRQRPTVPGRTIQASELQDSVLSMAANRDPSYDVLADLLIAGNFLREDYKKYPRYTSNSLGEAITLHSAYVKGGGDKPFPEWLQWYSSTQEPDPQQAGPSRAGAYMGPRTTTSVSVTAKEDVERTLNTFAVDMLGRNLTDDELKKYTADYRKQEMGSPQVTTTTPQGQAATTSMTEQTVSRETIAQNILQDNPMFADNVIKTDVLDMFFNRLGGASSGS